MERQNGASSPAKIKRAFTGIYVLFLSSRAMITPFISAYLQEKGLTTGAIGLLTGISALAIIVTQPLWGMLSDRFRSVKRTLILCVLGQAAFAVSLTFAKVYLPLAVCFIAYSAFSASESTLLDLWCLGSVKAVGDGFALGPLRQWGCVGYAVVSALSGVFIARFSAGAILPVFAGMLTLIAVIMLFVKESGYQDAKRADIRQAGMRGILRNKAFVAYLMFAFFLQIPYRGSFTFYPLLIRQFGGNMTFVGCAGALMLLSEALIMALSKRMLQRFSPRTLILLSSLSFAVWYAVICLSANAYHVTAACVLQGPSYALFTFSTLYYLDEIAPEPLRATHQTVAYAVYFGMSGFAGNILSGRVINRFGYQTMYLTGIALTCAAALCYFYWTRKAGKTVPETKK